MADIPGAAGSSTTARSTTRRQPRAGGSSALPPGRSQQDTLSAPSADVEKPSSRKISWVNYGPNKGFEPTFQALFRTPFFTRLTRHLQSLENRERRLYLSRCMSKRIEEELEKWAKSPHWSDRTKDWS